MFIFQKRYFYLALILLLAELFIAIFVHDSIIRPYAGDFLVVILLYCCFRSFLNITVLGLAIPVLLFAYLVETLQYVNLINHLGLQHSVPARIIIGSSFEWIDMLAYTLGIFVVVVIENLRSVKAASSLPES